MPTGNLVKAMKPKFISLVDSPANQTPIRIVRSAAQPKGETTMNSKPGTRRIRRNAGGGNNAVLQIAFPADMEDAAIAATLMTYGMSDYRVERTETGVTATRSDLQSIARSDKTMEVKLTSNGITATLQRAAEAVVVTGKPEVAVIGLTFAADKFADAAAVAAWIERNSVDKASAPAQNPDSSFVVTRGAAEEGAETRQIELEEGVVATIVRSDCCDCPDGYVDVVCEQAYGNWGWGHLDFAAAMADVEFCEWMDKGLSKMHDVLWRILFYSQLPLDQRKELVAAALSQFGAFVSAVMDSMPRQLMISVDRSAQPKENLMSTQNQNAGGAATQATATQATQAAPAADNTPVTRADLTQAVAAAVTAALPETIKAIDAQRAAAAKEAEDKAAADKLAAENKPITRADLAAAVAEATKPLNETIEKLSGTTVVRSDNGDPATTTVAKPEGQGEKKDVFRGALGSLPVGGRKAKAAQAA